MDELLALIQQGLKLDATYEELYMQLGNYYDSLGLCDSAYLSYEQAYYYSRRNHRSDDLIKEIYRKLSGYRDSHVIAVRKVSVVILSYNTIKLTQNCIESIRRTTDPEVCRIIVVENASIDGSREWLREQTDIVLIENEENKGFPAGCNQGIAAADAEDDIFLLNSDTVLFDNSLFYLRIGLYCDGKNGSSGSVSNRNIEITDFPEDSSLIENYIRNTNLPKKNAYTKKAWLSGFALLIRRDALDEIGTWLDERYTPGYFEDNDIGIRLLEKGYQNILCRNSFIFHYGSQSFGQRPETSDLIARNTEIFKDQYGFHPYYYSGIRHELIRYIRDESDAKIAVLEVGCGLGETIGQIKYKFPNADVYGMEIVSEVARLASLNYDTIVCGDIEDELPYEEEMFDYIIFGDVLEHLVWPEKVLERMRHYLKPSGHIITSIPNIMNARVIYDLLHGDFTYRDSGILDRTHLRFFTRSEILKMFNRCGYEIEVLDASGQYGDMTDDFGEFFDRLLAIDGIAGKSEFDTFQYYLSARNAAG